MSKAIELINSIYNIEELEKEAQLQNELSDMDELLAKVASEAGADLSDLSAAERVELYNDIISKYNAQEAQGVQEGQTQQAGEAQHDGATAPGEQADPYLNFAMSSPERAQDFQMKVAETIYTSNLWAANNAERTAEYMSKIAEGMVDIIWSGLQQKMAGEDKKEEKDDKKHEAFEALAREHAMKAKEDMKKEASFDTAVALRAAEMILNGEV
ncbi:hypothetical protein E6Q11_02830 [Candidatus Dojkabacteria bacterium]|uniref:Uncharacterized protein n=1 Tax=Candidatus Dojkabacteria bacterium TaxID=2099670 RepID=A0A5C7J8V4_9BACT|nr:MAG: hypothetical protein E6Q11_02830 [Candidatus Dojkabacteria bacterium]